MVRQGEEQAVEGEDFLLAQDAVIGDGLGSVCDPVSGRKVHSLAAIELQVKK